MTSYINFCLINASLVHYMIQTCSHGQSEVLGPERRACLDMCSPLNTELSAKRVAPYTKWSIEYNVYATSTEA